MNLIYFKLIDFRYFTNEAEEDFVTAFSLLENSDYKHAVFNIQLAFEKYLKAYFIKYGIITNPREIGHIKYSQIANNFAELLKQDSDRFLEKPYIQKTDKIMIDYINKNITIFQKLESQESYQIACWKSSLNIPLTKNEENLLAGILNETINILRNFYSEIDKHSQTLSNEKSITMIKDPEALEKFVKIFINFLENIKTKGFQNTNPYEYLLEMENSLKPVLFGHGPNSMDLKDTIFVEKLFPLLRSMKWFDLSYASYCHRQISQYPTLIDGKYSGDLYKENAENLKKFFEQIRECCNEIKLEILPN